MGIFNPKKAAKSAYVVPLARSIRCSKIGIDLHHKHITLMSYICRLFADWRSSPVPMFSILRTFVADTLIAPVEIVDPKPDGMDEGNDPKLTGSHRCQYLKKYDKGSHY